MDKISIIVPFHNNEEYLDECIKSLINQTYSNLEIILVNDGSDDGSLKIAFKYAQKDSRIKIINQQKMGLGATRNSGIRYASGDYICFVDGDDFVNEDYCKHLMMLIKDGHADIAITSYIYKIADHYAVMLNPNPQDDQFDGVYSNQQWLDYSFKIDANLRVVVWGKMYRRGLFDNIVFPSKWLAAEDTQVNWQLLLKASRIAFKNYPDYRYRRHGKTRSQANDFTNYRKRVLEQQIALLHLVDINPQVVVSNYRDLLQLSHDKGLDYNSVKKLRQIIKHYKGK